MEVAIPYKPSKLIMLAVFVFCVACTVTLGYIAIEGNTALSLFRLVKLSPSQATPVFWFLAFSSFTFSAGALLMIYYGATSAREIVFRDDTLQFPKKGWNKDYLSIKYSDIVEAGEISISGTKIFSVYFNGGKIDLSSSMVPNKKYYEQFKTELARRAGG